MNATIRYQIQLKSTQVGPNKWFGILGGRDFGDRQLAELIAGTNQIIKSGSPVSEYRIARLETIETAVSHLIDGQWVAAPEPARLQVAAYTPKNEAHPILIPLCAGRFVGYAVRRGEPLYSELLAACNGKPEWIFGEHPKPLE